MFSPSLLYDPATNQKTVIGFHALAMCHVARNLLGGIPSGMAATLQMQTLLGHDIADQDVPRYLLGKDPYGYQVYICPALSWKDQWSDIMQSGMGTTSLFADACFNALVRVANLIFNDLITRVTVTDNLFIGAHGPYAGVANYLCKQLVATGHRVRQVYKVAAPKCFPDKTWNALDELDVHNVQVKRNDDATVDCPPALLSYDGWGRGIISFATGSDSVLPILSRYGIPSYVGHGYLSTGDASPDWPQRNALRHIGSPLHWHDDVPDEAWHQGTTDAYIVDYWSQLTRPFHARLNDWRTLLNGNYGFQLRSLVNLGL